MPSSAAAARRGCTSSPLAVAQAGFRLPTHAEVAPSPALQGRVVFVPLGWRRLSPRESVGQRPGTVAGARGFSHVDSKAASRWPACRTGLGLLCIPRQPESRRRFSRIRPDENKAVSSYSEWSLPRICV